MNTSAPGQERKIVPGSKIIGRLKAEIAQKELLCHGDGPSYNDHSTGGHDKDNP